MATSAVWVKPDEGTFAQKLAHVCAQLTDTTGDVVVDLSSINRIGTDELKAIEQLARAARDGHRKVTLRAVNVGVYKVLKVARLTTHFSFLN